MAYPVVGVARFVNDFEYVTSRRTLVKGVPVSIGDTHPVPHASRRRSCVETPAQALLKSNTRSHMHPMRLFASYLYIRA
jgi:hypothetical protein